MRTSEFTVSRLRQRLGDRLFLGLVTVLGLSVVGLAVAMAVVLGRDAGPAFERFGFFSVAGMVTVPLSSMPTRVGSWNIHGGVEYVRLGDRNAEILGDTSKVIGSIGIGLSY